jgi:hypothetical protein
MRQGLNLNFLASQVVLLQRPIVPKAPEEVLC